MTPEEKMEVDQCISMCPCTPVVASVPGAARPCGPPINTSSNILPVAPPWPAWWSSVVLYREEVWAAPRLVVAPSVFFSGGFCGRSSVDVDTRHQMFLVMYEDQRCWSRLEGAASGGC